MIWGNGHLLAATTAFRGGQKRGANLQSVLRPASGRCYSNPEDAFQIADKRKALSQALKNRIILWRKKLKLKIYLDSYPGNFQNCILEETEK